MDVVTAQKKKDELNYMAARLAKAHSMDVDGLRRYQQLYDQVQTKTITLANDLLSCAASEGFQIEEKRSQQVEASMLEYLNSDYYLREKELAEAEISKGNIVPFLDFCRLVRSELRRIVSDEGEGIELEEWKAFWV